jgi:hypothetical protein
MRSSTRDFAHGHALINQPVVGGARCVLAECQALKVLAVAQLKVTLDKWSVSRVRVMWCEIAKTSSSHTEIKLLQHVLIGCSICGHPAAQLAGSLWPSSFRAPVRFCHDRM